LCELTDVTAQLSDMRRGIQTLLDNQQLFHLLRENQTNIDRLGKLYF